jgi:hypothetical protein
VQAIAVVAVDLAVAVAVNAVVAVLLYAPAIVVHAVDLAVAVAVNAVMAVVLADRGSFASHVRLCRVHAVRAEGVCAVVNPGAENAIGYCFANDRARAIAVRQKVTFALELWSLAVSIALASAFRYDASGAG